ncbi:hypothetical protein BKA66DRAFT_456847 [Pyrenochaeta sp. MPI-SDFR-AT-0127]|nr:hypothetical protein BKA66DRAFT_456847 [Pyrenochaeta sp. MPI-SDFR-AT-0127]
MYILELGSSSDKRIRSMNTALVELSNKYEMRLKQQQLDTNHARMSHVKVEQEAEEDSRQTVIEQKRNSNDEFALSSTALEREVEALREDKKAFERLVATLQEKCRQLEVLKEWKEPIQTVEASSSLQDPNCTSPLSERTLSSRPTTMGHLSVHNNRPATHASTISQEVDLDTWAREFERKARHELKESLKHSEAQLHQLEKQAKPKRHRTLLRKSRPSLPPSLVTEPGQSPLSPQLSPRPATAGGLPFTSDCTTNSQHRTIHFPARSDDRPRTTSSPSSQRWSMFPRPTISQRPTTSYSLTSRPNEQLRTSREEYILDRPKNNRRWSSRLHNLFKDR